MLLKKIQRLPIARTSQHLAKVNHIICPRDHASARGRTRLTLSHACPPTRLCARSLTHGHTRMEAHARARTRTRTRTHIHAQMQYAHARKRARAHAHAQAHAHARLHRARALTHPAGTLPPGVPPAHRDTQAGRFMGPGVHARTVYCQADCRLGPSDAGPV